MKDETQEQITKYKPVLYCDGYDIYITDPYGIHIDFKQEGKVISRIAMITEHAESLVALLRSRMG